MFGFLNVYKPSGITSHDVISRLRKILHIKKIGHAGTLDPLAEGVLPVAISNATKLIDFLPNEKEYIAEFKLGFTSKSYDTECELEFYSSKKVKAEDICEVLKSFKGEIKQTPPIYSAIKVNGKKLYELAREGERADIPERTIVVEKIELKEFDEENQIGKLLVACTKGTYIRSIINDIGKNLDTGAVMTGLIRSKSGGMQLETSINLNDITSEDIVKTHLIDVNEILKFAETEIDDQDFEKVKNGNPIKRENVTGNVFVLKNGEIIAYGEGKNGLVKMRKVFVN